MTDRERYGLVYLDEAAAALMVSRAVLEKLLYHRALRGALSRRYSRRPEHPRRVRLLTPDDMQLLARYVMVHGAHFAVFRPR